MTNGRITTQVAQMALPLAAPVAFLNELGNPEIVGIRDATFRKMTNRNQTDTNEMATTKTEYQTDFYSSEKYQH